MSIIPILAQANIRTADLVAKADGSAITSGTVNFYVKALTGDNANKWFKTSDDSWDAVESIAGVMTHGADGHYHVSIDAACWIDGVQYIEYAKESGDLHTPVSNHIRCGNNVAQLQLCFDILGGRGHIIANQLLHYKADNVTLVKTKDLTNAAGDPAMVNVTQATVVGE